MLYCKADAESNETLEHLIPENDSDGNESCVIHDNFDPRTHTIKESVNEEINEANGRLTEEISQTIFHVGIYPNEKCVFVYSSMNDIKCIPTYLEHPYFSGSIFTVEGMPFSGIEKYHPKDTFEIIKENIDGQHGNVCVVLEFDKKFYEKYKKYALKCGFKKVEFIDPYIGIYLHATFFSSYIPKNGDVIWIVEKSGYHVWEKIDGKANYIGFSKNDLTKRNNLIKQLKSPQFSKIPNILLFDNDQFKEYDDLLLENGIAAFKFENQISRYPDLFIKWFQFRCAFTKGALIHIRSMDGDPAVSEYAVVRTLNRHVEIKLNNKVIKKIEKTQSLPFTYSIKLSKTGNKLSINDEYMLANDPMKDEYLVYYDPKDVYFETEEYNNILCTIKFDENKMLQVDCKPLILSDDENSDEFIENYYSNEFSNDSNFTILPYEINLSQKYYNPKEGLIDLTKIDAVGIDFGTTKCCAAVYRQNGVESVALDNLGSRILPSYVAFDEGHVKCGEVVVSRLRNHSKSTVFDAKRLLGKTLEDIYIDKSWEFDLSNDNKKLQIIVDGLNGRILKYPEDVSGALLKHIKTKAEEFQGKTLSEAVITIPVAFNEAQKDATFASALLAGWQKIHLLYEPVAASIAYFREKPIPNNSTLLLFDLGGGTMDVCIFRISENSTMDIICENGDSNFGGRDFDNVLVNFFEKKMLEDYGISVGNNKVHKLLLKCQELKHALTVDEEFSFDVSDFDPSCDDFIKITRKDFENLSHNLLTKIENCINAALNKAHFTTDQMNLVLYVGGGCRMPMVKTLLNQIFPLSQHCCETHPDEVVAIGAAYYAFYLQAEEGKNQYRNKFTKFFYENFYYRSLKERSNFLGFFVFLPIICVILFLEKVLNINTHLL